VKSQTLDCADGKRFRRFVESMQRSKRSRKLLICYRTTNILFTLLRNLQVHILFLLLQDLQVHP
jgi:hypothetical protein